jgi:hypothetical protein
MKIDELTKQQIVLLCFLVAFVSSTASAIVVVRLMEEAPVTASPTINRVIERTVQQIVPGETREITKVNTVVIKEEDLVVEAIDKNRSSVVLVRETIPGEESDTEIVNGSGLYLEDGYVIADGRLISGPGEYYIQDGEVKIPLTFVSRDESKFSILRVDESIDLSELSFAPKSLVSNIDLRVGQSAIVLSANPSMGAFTGLVSSFNDYSVATEDGEETLFSKIDINISLDESHSGGILVTSDGDIAGLVMVRDNDIFAIPASYLIDRIADTEEVAAVPAEDLSASAIEALPEAL